MPQDELGTLWISTCITLMSDELFVTQHLFCLLTNLNYLFYLVKRNFFFSTKLGPKEIWNCCQLMRLKCVPSLLRASGPGQFSGV